MADTLDIGIGSGGETPPAVYADPSDVRDGVDRGDGVLGTLGAAVGTGFEAERQAIEGFFKTMWGSSSPVEYENRDTGVIRDDIYVSLKILGGDSTVSSFGNDNTYRYFGVILIQVYGKKGAGTVGLKTLADKAHDIFRSQEFSNILCKVPQVRPAILIEDRYMVPVRIPFERNN